MSTPFAGMYARAEKKKKKSREKIAQMPPQHRRCERKEPYVKGKIS